MKILIVDDCPENISIIEKTLDQEGFVMAVSTSGVEALNIAPKFMPDLILLDITMPGLNGFETCQRLKADIRTKNMPVIFLTARASIEDTIKGFECGAVDYIQKPYQVEEVLVRVRTQLKMVSLLNHYQKFQDILNENMKDLQRSNSELNQFAGMASHDLQEPLRKIRYFSDKLEKFLNLGNENPGASKWLAKIRNSVDKMQSLIHSLLQLSKVGQIRSFEQVDLEELVSEVLTDLEPRIREKRGTVHVDSLPTVEADRIQMRQLFQSLISNSIKFHRKEEPPLIHIKASLCKQSNMWKITVQDNGVGFNEKHLSKIFKPFQRLCGKDEFEGNGMGTAICHKIIENHHGAITAQSVPNQGSTFIVKLPKSQLKIQ
ncbi:MAG: response regulator [Nitrospinae bacterium]|nr:response regulator [Nitrospinota bacterium]